MFRTATCPQLIIVLANHKKQWANGLKATCCTHAGAPCTFLNIAQLCTKLMFHVQPSTQLKKGYEPTMQLKCAAVTLKQGTMTANICVLPSVHFLWKAPFAATAMVQTNASPGKAPGHQTAKASHLSVLVAPLAPALALPLALPCHLHWSQRGLRTQRAWLVTG